MTGYIIEVQENNSGDLFIEFPDELIDELGWQEGDILNWDLKGDGIVLSKVHDASGYQVEDQN
jgi:bifunctional DNA-binding transcriptional regulator/antitoxin component of YhaV-PrlF toxin-antitoxin module